MRKLSALMMTTRQTKEVHFVIRIAAEAFAGVPGEKWLTFADMTLHRRRDQVG